MFHITLFIIRLVGHMEEGAFSGDEELTLMLLNNVRMMMQPLELEPSVRDFQCIICQSTQLLVTPQAMQLRNKLLKRYFSAEQAVRIPSQNNEDNDILRELSYIV